MNQNPCHKISLPKLESEEKRPLSDEEIEKLRLVLENNSCDNGILFILNSGVRIGELLALKWEDIDMKRKDLMVKSTLSRITKTGGHLSEGDVKTELAYESPKTKNSNRCIPLSDTLVDILLKQQEYLNTIKALNEFKADSIVFPTTIGTPIDPHNFNRHLVSICERARFRSMKSHIFRHTFITMAVRNKMDPRLLKRIVGHSNIGITDAVYTHIQVDDLRDAMNGTKKHKKKRSPTRTSLLLICLMFTMLFLQLMGQSDGSELKNQAARRNEKPAIPYGMRVCGGGR